MKLTKRDWTEDFEYENGMYRNKCIKCEHEFTGYKRRLICKICATSKADALKRLLGCTLYILQIIIVWLPILLIDILLPIVTNKTYEQCRTETKEKLKDGWAKVSA